MLVDHKNVDDLAYRKDFQTHDTFTAKVDYFSWATQMLEVGNFKCLKDQMIWEYHTEGLSRNRIGERVGLGGRWCSRKIKIIKEYLQMTTASQYASYG